MYAIIWKNDLRWETVVGDARSIVAVAGLLEKSRTPFKVSSCAGGLYLPQSHFGCEGYEFWNNGADKF